MTLATKKKNEATGSLWDYLSGENKFSLALVVIAFLGQLIIICGETFGFLVFANQISSFIGKFVTLFMLYFGGATLKSANMKKKEAEGDNA